MPGSREIKRRIKSVTSTKKITRAMQMVSAAKMRKAQTAALASRTYSDLAWQIITNLSHRVDPKYHGLLETNRRSGRTAVVLITTNRGQVGSFNANLIAAAQRHILQTEGKTPADTDIITVGKKGRDAMLRAGNTLVAEFEKIDRHVPPEEVLPISRLLLADYLAGKYGKILVAYNHFVSTLNQKPTIKQILPLQQDSAGKFTDVTGKEESGLPEQRGKFNYEYLFEPNPHEVLDYMLPRIVEAQLYQAILESDASEHSARMVMMKNATDAAGDIIDDLTLEFNRLRQANITKELAEITAGKIALE